MNATLYAIRDESDEAKVRAWIPTHGGRIAKEKIRPLLTGDRIQFWVIVDGALWILEPRGKAYMWFKSRPACTCAEDLCVCRKGPDSLNRLVA